MVVLPAELDARNAVVALEETATYLIRANPLLTYAQKPRTETEEKAYSSERAKEAVR